MRIMSSLKTQQPILWNLLGLSAVVTVWRGLWGLMDEYLFPNNYKLSLWVSVFWGILLLGAMDILQNESLV